MHLAGHHSNELGKGGFFSRLKRCMRGVFFQYNEGRLFNVSSFLKDSRSLFLSIALMVFAFG